MITKTKVRNLFIVVACIIIFSIIAASIVAMQCEEIFLAQWLKNFGASVVGTSLLALATVIGVKH